MQVDLLMEADGWAELDLAAILDRAGRAVMAELEQVAAHEVSVLACDDARIAGLNTEFRDKAGPTNVLSWPSVDLVPEIEGAMPDLAAAPLELGDIAIAYETCLREAEAQGKTLEDHATHLLVHGLLHLFGFDHIRDKDADLMEAMESRILAKLGIADPYDI